MGALGLPLDIYPRDVDTVPIRLAKNRAADAKRRVGGEPRMDRLHRLLRLSPPATLVVQNVSSGSKQFDVLRSGRKVLCLHLRH